MLQFLANAEMIRNLKVNCFGSITLALKKGQLSTDIELCFVLLCYTSREAISFIRLFIDPNCTKIKIKKSVPIA